MEDDKKEGVEGDNKAELEDEKKEELEGDNKAELEEEKKEELEGDNEAELEEEKKEVVEGEKEVELEDVELGYLGESSQYPRPLDLFSWVCSRYSTWVLDKAGSDIATFNWMSFNQVKSPCKI